MADHSGHRKRLRQKFTNNMSLDGFDEASVLELLLFYSIPRTDTRGTAETLLRKFGSLRDVLEAPFEELRDCPGVGEASAILIKLVPSFAKAYYTSESAHTVFLPDINSAKQFLEPRYYMQNDEVCILLALDNRGTLLRAETLSRGGRDFADVSVDKVLSLLKTCGATTAIISHNHPAGLCVPSREDTETTVKLINELKNDHIRLVDHLIFADDKIFSYAESSKFGKYFSY